MSKLQKLFITTFGISAFSIGGGYVIVSMMKKKFVDELQWIDEQEMLDIIAIASSTPGVIAVNASILLGYRIGKIRGALTAVLATVLPPLVMLSVIFIFYDLFRENLIVSIVLKGMQAGVAALLVDVVLNLGKTAVKSKDSLSYLIILAAFAASFFFKINIIIIIITCVIIGSVRQFFTRSIK
jgi:chromate transporter